MIVSLALGVPLCDRKLDQRGELRSHVWLSWRTMQQYGFIADSNPTEKDFARLEEYKAVRQLLLAADGD